MRPVLLTALFVVGCSSSNPAVPASPATQDAGPVGQVDASAEAGNDADTRAALTYYADIKPLIETHCTRCHQKGAIGPFELTTYANVRSQLEGIRDQVEARKMPPWPAAPNCSEYVGDRSLADAERNALIGWIDNGAPEGDPATARSGQPASTPLSRIDRHMAMAEPYTQQTFPDEYRCFLLDWPETADAFVTGFQAIPGNPDTVHHALVFATTPDSVAAFQTRDANDPGPGYACYGLPGNFAEFSGVGTWAPGAEGGDFPSGTGLKVRAGSKLVIQVHYHSKTFLPESDQTAIDVKVDSTVAKEALLYPIFDPAWLFGGMSIPKGSSDTVHRYEADPAAFSYKLYSSTPHMHTRGTRVVLNVERANTSECLVDIPDWNFDWQLTYWLKEPKTVSIGDRLSLECHWDNSQGTADLNWGEKTTDEMCTGAFYITRE